MRCTLPLASLLLAPTVLGEDFEDVDLSKTVFETVVLQEISDEFTETDLKTYYSNFHDQYEARLKDAKGHLFTFGGFDANIAAADGSSVFLHCYHSPLRNLTVQPEAGYNYGREVAAMNSNRNKHTPKDQLRSGYLAAAIALSDPGTGFSAPHVEGGHRVRIVALVTNDKSEIGIHGGVAGPGAARPFSLRDSNDCTCEPPTVEELSLLFKMKDAYLIIVAPQGEVAESYDAVCSQVDEGRCSVVRRSQPDDLKGTELMDEIVDVANFAIDDSVEDNFDEKESSSSSTDAPTTVTSSSSTTSSSSSTSPSSSSSTSDATAPAIPSNVGSSSSSSSTSSTSSTSKPASSSNVGSSSSSSSTPSTSSTSKPASSSTTTHSTTTSDAAIVQKAFAILLIVLSMAFVARF